MPASPTLSSLPLAGLLVLCRRARIGSKELTPELLLTLLWLMESCESQCEWRGWSVWLGVAGGVGPGQAARSEVPTHALFRTQVAPGCRHLACQFQRPAPLPSMVCPADRNDLGHCLKLYLRFHPSAHYLKEGLRRRMVALQAQVRGCCAATDALVRLHAPWRVCKVRVASIHTATNHRSVAKHSQSSSAPQVLERCSWRVLLRDRQELRAALEELESDRRWVCVVFYSSLRRQSASRDGPMEMGSNRRSG